MNNDRTYFYTLTAFDDPDQVAVALALANASLASGTDTILWTTMEGVHLAKEGAVNDMISPSFNSVKELLDIFSENGGRIGICPACAKTHGVTDENMVNNGIWMGAMAVIEATHKRNILSF